MTLATIEQPTKRRTRKAMPAGIMDKHGVRYVIERQCNCFYVRRAAAGPLVAHARLVGDTVVSVKVYRSHERRRGIATALYDYIERECSVTLQPSRIRQPDGKAFWKARKEKA